MPSATRYWMDVAQRGWSAAVPAAAGFAISVQLVYPGFMTWDSTAQYEQVVTGRVANAHPPMMVYLWTLTDALIRGPGGLFLIHAAAYWSGWALVVATVARSWYARLALIAVLGFFPPLIGLVPMLWKDIGALSALLLSVGFLALGRSSGRPRLALATLPPLFYAAAVRSMDFLAALPLLWVVAASLVPRGEEVAPVAGRRVPRRLFAFVGLAALFASGLAAINSIGVERTSYRAAVPLWDLATLSLLRNEMLIPAYAIHPSDLGLPRLRRITRPLRCDFHDPADGGKVTQDMNYPNLTSAEADRLIADWLVVIARHPGDYVSHRWKISQLLLADPAFKLHHEMESIRSFRLPFRFEMRPGYRRFRAALRRATRTFLYQPWVYLLLAAGALGSAFAIGGGEARLARAVAGSGLLSVAHLPVTAPSTDFRYSSWLIAAAVVSSLLVGRAVTRRKDPASLRYPANGESPDAWTSHARPGVD